MAEPVDLVAIDARAQAATAGPWVPVERLAGGFEIHESTNTGCSCGRKGCGGSLGGSSRFFGKRDSDFIAQARVDVPAMVAALRATRQALEGFMEDAVETARTSFSHLMGGQEVWNDEIWQEADPDGYALYVAGVAALALVTDAPEGCAP